MDWKLFAWFKRGKRRKEVLALLSNARRPLTTKEIKLNLRMAISQASFTIKELYEHGLIDCLNPNDKIGRLYKINNKGQEMLNEI